VQRAAVAPFEGYLREAPARAGDRVKAGQVLAVLDDKDLQLERVRWESELEVALRKEREGMAKGNRVDQRLAAAQANQARAQLDLVLGKLERVQRRRHRSTAWSSRATCRSSWARRWSRARCCSSWRRWTPGASCSRSTTATSATWPGAPGELVLASVPGSGWPFTVKQAHADRRWPRRVATTSASRPTLGDAAPKLSPNMEGVAKVDVGRESLLWIWTRLHRLAAAGVVEGHAMSPGGSVDAVTSHGISSRRALSAMAKPLLSNNWYRVRMLKPRLARPCAPASPRIPRPRRLVRASRTASAASTSASTSPAYRVIST
jgi:pyruvate/2-oxoglutarate dehydrogenase complex dihydrolipoamide acyltransferase (E2) component